MTDLEAITLKEIELLKAKAAIAVAVINHVQASTLVAYPNEGFKLNMIDTIKQVQATLE
ncbi:hypothetical protein [Acinetobacter sp. NyZ410]|uniref:hypothetical protein n=1 Tax=Acinetobacter sp. NyZ410 TaxID=2929509 RepID=UPI001FBBF9F9|nr:hypothetical protein [Acinetobacter sp. NyZ410]UOH16924.1 hypothetical protein MTO68_13920 [Acinetobacter sp. NyZ410]